MASKAELRDELALKRADLDRVQSDISESSKSNPHTPIHELRAREAALESEILNIRSNLLGKSEGCIGGSSLKL